jgi:hypothetical protein
MRPKPNETNPTIALFSIRWVQDKWISKLSRRETSPGHAELRRNCAQSRSAEKGAVAKRRGTSKTSNGAGRGGRTPKIRRLGLPFPPAMRTSADSAVCPECTVIKSTREDRD